MLHKGEEGECYTAHGEGTNLQVRKGCPGKEGECSKRSPVCPPSRHPQASCPRVVLGPKATSSEKQLVILQQRLPALPSMAPGTEGKCRKGGSHGIEEVGQRERTARIGCATGLQTAQEPAQIQPPRLVRWRQR